MSETVVFVCIHDAHIAVNQTVGNKVRHNLRNLESVSVVDQGKRSIMPENLVGDSAVEPWTSKNLVPNRVLSLLKILLIFEKAKRRQSFEKLASSFLGHP